MPSNCKPSINVRNGAGRVGASCILASLAVLLSAAPVPAQSDEAPTALKKKVLLIGIDGCRFDALRAVKTKHLEGLIAEGCFADDTQILGERLTKSDTVSGPGWSSLLTGVWADKHGVEDNSTSARWMKPGTSMAFIQRSGSIAPRSSASTDWWAKCSAR